MMVLFGPVVGSSLLVSFFFRDGDNVLERLKGMVLLDAQKGLLKQGLFWLSIIVPISYFFSFGMIAWEEYTLNLSLKGLGVFFQISKIPFAFLSISIPMSVLVSRLHSTEQTAKQMALMKLKNNMDAHYLHRSELFNYFDRINAVEYLGALTGKFNVHPRVHKNFFIVRPEFGIPDVNREMFHKIENLLDSSRLYIDSVLKNVNPEMTLNFYMCNACVCIWELSRSLGLPEIYHELGQRGLLVELNVNDGFLAKCLSVGTKTEDLIAAYRYISDYYLNLCDFANVEKKEAEDKYRYLGIGGQFRSMKPPNVIEELHADIIIPLYKKQTLYES